MDRVSILSNLKYSLALLLGVCLAQQLNSFPTKNSIFFIALVAFSTVILLHRFSFLSLLAWSIFAGAWSMIVASNYLDHRFDTANDGDDLRLQLQVVSLPVSMQDGIRFDAKALHSKQFSHGMLRISWYEEKSSVKTGEILDVTVRLRAPRGVRNPGGFDFERYALTRDLLAVGYVRQVHARTSDTQNASLLAFRARISEKIQLAVADPQLAGFIKALAVGDQRNLEDQEWDVLRATGTGHLISISGLHLGMLAAIGVMFARLLFFFLPRLGLLLPRIIFESSLALVFALAYSLAAGFEIPVLRSLLMIICVLLARLWRRSTSPWAGLSTACSILLLWDPRIVLGASFWLSFGGVFWLTYILHEPNQNWRAWLKALIKMQFILGLALLPLGVWFFAQSSTVAPLTNLIAIPWVNFFVVPVALLGVAANLIAPTIATALFALSAVILQPLWIFLQWCAQWDFALFYFSKPTIGAILFSCAGVLTLNLPRGLWFRYLGLFFFLPLFSSPANQIQNGEVRITMLDVGQGSAFLVRTANHSMQYDAGPKFRSGLDSGESVVVPALRALGLSRIDHLVISHGDNDHAGGANAVRAALLPKRALSGHVDPEFVRCETGQKWRWDEVDFEVLHPPQYFPDLGNDSSCVVQIRNASGAILMTGDISDTIEARLVEEYGEKLQSNVMLVPHHGSHSASSDLLIEAVKPTHALISAGYRSRFGHPAASVVARYKNHRVKIIESAIQGASTLKLKADGQIEIDLGERIENPNYWSIKAVPTEAALN